jgi:hypothetical protein
VLDPFWESKGYVGAEEFRLFCAPTVLLARMRQSIYKTSERLSVDVEIAHYGQKPLVGHTGIWAVADLSGSVQGGAGTFQTRDIPIGKNIPLGKVDFDLQKMRAPAQYKLVVGVEGAVNAVNAWNFWVYPAQVDTTAPADVLVTSNWRDAHGRLAKGGKVVFTPAVDALDDTSPPLNNVPVFWNRLMNPRLEAMMGLRDFPPKSSATGNGRTSSAGCARSTSKKRRHSFARSCRRLMTGTATTSWRCCSSATWVRGSCSCALRTFKMIWRIEPSHGSFGERC